MITREDLPLIKNILSLHNKDLDVSFMYDVLTAVKDNENLQGDIFDSFSENQFKSKLRLLQMIDSIDLLDENSEVVIFGSWYGSILIPNLANNVKKINCVDLDERVLKIAKNRLFPTYSNVDYIAADMFEKDRGRYHTCDLFINTSCEHMQPMNEWPYWLHVKPNSYFAFQSNNMFDIEGHINCVSSMEEFKSQLPDGAIILHQDEIEDTRGTRYMIIGKFTAI